MIYHKSLNSWMRSGKKWSFKTENWCRICGPSWTSLCRWAAKLWRKRSQRTSDHRSSKTLWTRQLSSMKCLWPKLLRKMPQNNWLQLLMICAFRCSKSLNLLRRHSDTVRTWWISDTSASSSACKIRALRSRITWRRDLMKSTAWSRRFRRQLRTWSHH